ncbi:MAG: 6-carboxytetrahydropterin synthase QueD [Betaproteobacteria bacterium]|nr:6-carboxytetrahydropterin synthase QueD [Betaproteobacteria bacterium]
MPSLPSPPVTITRKLEFDAGHRLPNHKSQCRNIHGHRYVLEITLSAQVIHEEGAADDGMVMDFGDVKRIAQETLVNRWDHAFLVYREDRAMVDFLATIADHKTVVLDVVPTAENLAQVAFQTLRDAYQDRFGHTLKLSHLRLYETPNCWADVSAPD